MTRSANLYATCEREFPADRTSTFLVTAPAGERYSYADVDRRSARLARFLSDLGVKPGDRVSVQAHKSPALVWLYLACVRAGFVFHPLNPAYTGSEIDYFLRDAAPTVIVVDPELLPVVGPLREKFGIPHLFTLDGDGAGTMMDASRHSNTEWPTVSSKPHDVAALLYSSGTTGQPKGVMLTHANLTANARALVDTWGFTGNDVLLHTLPIFHVHGLFVALGCVLMSGAAMQFLSKFDADQVIRALPQSTVMMGVPTYYTRLLATVDFNKACCRNMRLFTSGSAPLRKDTFHAFHERSGHVILERYGMTETSIISSNPLQGVRKPGAVGFPLQGVDVRVVDNDGQVLERNRTGRVQVRGASVFPGYWRMPDKTREDFTEDGFFDTGDQGLVDDDHYLTLIGRAKDMIISGGLNVYPKEIERVIDEMPEVQEAAVIAVPHADLGEAVVAVVMLRQGETISEENVRRVLKRTLAGYKVPKRVIAIDELPRNTLGKVQKNILRDRFSTIMDSA